MNSVARKWRETRVLKMWTYPKLRRELSDHDFVDIHLYGRQNSGAKEATPHAPRLVIVARRK